MNLTTLNTHIITSRAVSAFLSDPPSTDDNDRLTVVPLQPFNLINNLKDIVVFLGFVSFRAVEMRKSLFRFIDINI